jgi:hypothetical protein
MRDDEVVQLDNGPRVAKMFRLMVEFIAEREDIPMGKVYQRALELFVADYEWTKADLTDYYGKRADDLDGAMHEMKLRGIRTKRENSTLNRRTVKAA